MGGINQGNIAQVVARGARHPAVMSAVTAAADVIAAAEGLKGGDYLVRESADMVRAIYAVVTEPDVKSAIDKLQRLFRYRNHDVF